ncbi:MAG TPA: hypothetical protein DIW46_08750 [Microbacterium sp.]|nr:hypothetical protein [Microbacterium sp.]
MRDTTSSGDDAKERFAAIMRTPRRAALISGALVPVALAVNLFVLENISWPLLGVPVVATLVCVLAMWNVINFSPSVVARLEGLSPAVGGRFTLWKAGVGDYEGTPFAYGTDHQRFGMLNYTVQGMPVEIGHLASQVSARAVAPTGRRHAYVVVRLPERLPHMILSFGHLSRVLGVRIAPDQWHRSQRVDVGSGRGSRLFVGDGGEQIARGFFNREMVQLFRLVGRHYDVEIKDRNLYLYAARSAAAGTANRWSAQRALIENLAASMANSGVWDLVRRQSRGRGPVYRALRADVARGAAIFFSVAGVAVVVLSAIVINAAGLLE